MVNGNRNICNAFWFFSFRMWIFLRSFVQTYLDRMVSRTRLHYCKIILATSLVWFLLDVFILMYFTDCAANSGNTNCNEHREESRRHQDSGGGGFLGKLLPKGKQWHLCCQSFGEFCVAISFRGGSVLPILWRVLCCNFFWGWFYVANFLESSMLPVLWKGGGGSVLSIFWEFFVANLLRSC